MTDKAVQCIKGRKLAAKDGCVTGRCRTPSCDNLIISQNTYSSSMYCYCQKVSDLFAYSLAKSWCRLWKFCDIKPHKGFWKRKRFIADDSRACTVNVLDWTVFTLGLIIAFLSILFVFDNPWWLLGRLSTIILYLKIARSLHVCTVTHESRCKANTKWSLLLLIKNFKISPYIYACLWKLMTL